MPVEKLDLCNEGCTFERRTHLNEPLEPRLIVLKLTRLNNQTIAINPDHVVLVDVAPDTTIRLLTGDKLIVRESLDELIALYVELRRKIHETPAGTCPLGAREGRDMGFAGAVRMRKQGES